MVTCAPGIAIVPVAVPHRAATETHTDAPFEPYTLPAAGGVLWVLPASTDSDALTYRGSVPLEASPAWCAGARPVGVVWHRQPAQVVASRGIALVAVVTRGVVDLAQSLGAVPPGRAPGDPFALAGCGIVVGMWLSPTTAWLTGEWPCSTT